MGRIGWIVASGLLIPAQPVVADQTVAAGATSGPATMRRVTIKRDTPLDLIATKEINSSEVKAGYRFTLAVNTPLVIDGITVIPFLAKVTGEITGSSDAGGLGRNGAVAARLLYLTVGDARIPVSGEVSNAGNGAGSARLAVAFAGLLGLFHRGNDGRIKAGQHVAAFIAEDTAFDIGAVPVRRIEPEAAPATQTGAVLPADSPLTLVTLEDLSSKTARTGDYVRLQVRDDVYEGRHVLIPAGTAAVGQVAEAHGTGGFSVDGVVEIVPLSLQIGGETVRLAGGGMRSEGAGESGAARTIGGPLVIGLRSGRTATIPAGSLLEAWTLRAVRLPLAKAP